MKAKGKAPKDDRWKAKYKEPVAPDLDILSDLPSCVSVDVVFRIGLLGNCSGIVHLRSDDGRTGHVAVRPGVARHRNEWGGWLRPKAKRAMYET
jgi:hypothetical protein